MMNLETLQLDSPEIPEACREAYRQRFGAWPESGQLDDRAAVWAMAWLSKPDAQVPDEMPEPVRCKGEPDESFWRRHVYRNGWNECLKAMLALGGSRHG